jgi:hypothetical protein
MLVVLREVDYKPYAADEGSEKGYVCILAHIPFFNLPGASILNLEYDHKQYDERGKEQQQHQPADHQSDHTAQQTDNQSEQPTDETQDQSNGAHNQANNEFYQYDHFTLSISFVIYLEIST